MTLWWAKEPKSNSRYTSKIMRQRVEHEIYNYIPTVTVMRYCVERQYLEKKHCTIWWEHYNNNMMRSLNLKNNTSTIFERTFMFGFPLNRQYNIILLLLPFLAGLIQWRFKSDLLDKFPIENLLILHFPSSPRIVEVDKGIYINPQCSI